ncbi:hypothetical protein DOY81_001191 [Sarcophaga bullata]|nr:hypothetical protein DOY81_001191 [Sarcophaga bullata]
MHRESDFDSLPSVDFLGKEQWSSLPKTQRFVAVTEAEIYFVAGNKLP